MEELRFALLCRIVLIPPHLRVFEHEGHAEHLDQCEPFRGGLVGVFQIITQVLLSFGAQTDDWTFSFSFW